MATGAIDPAAITTVYPLDDHERAFADLAKRRIVKALLTPRPLTEVAEPA
jgi:threonine dehydrogenase-like Zn-dependent dehydrogenase